MYSVLIKHTFIFLFTIYTNLKLFNKSTKNFKAFCSILMLAFSLGIITKITNEQIPAFSYLLPLMILWIMTSLLNSRPQFSFIVTSISFGINYCMQALSGFIATIILYLLSSSHKNFLVRVFILSAILHAIFIFLLVRIKRLRKGLPLLNTTNYINIATIICLTFNCFVIYSTTSISSKWIKLLIFITIIFALAFLIFWWQAQITKTYRYRLLMRELESLRTSAAEKDALIEKLYAENNRLARITHRDNSLITALKDAAIKGLRTDFENPEEMIAAREKLIANIEKLAEGRNSISPNYNEKTAREFDTGLSLLDDLLHHMDSKAMEQDITFSVHFGIVLKDFVPQTISESDLVHTVDDLLKNAFKSTLTCESRVVQLQFYKLGKHLVIEVADNGIPFEVRSLVNMGVEKLTTYEDGSGIGLMDIWCTKEKYRATYHLDEYAAPSPFSKKISLTFDKKNRYTIRTYRKDEILQMSRRVDLQVYDDRG